MAGSRHPAGSGHPRAEDAGADAARRRAGDRGGSGRASSPTRTTRATRPRRTALAAVVVHERADDDVEHDADRDDQRAEPLPERFRLLGSSSLASSMSSTSTSTGSPTSKISGSAYSASTTSGSYSSGGACSCSRTRSSSLRARRGSASGHTCGTRSRRARSPCRTASSARVRQPSCREYAARPTAPGQRDLDFVHARAVLGGALEDDERRDVVDVRGRELEGARGCPFRRSRSRSSRR